MDASGETRGTGSAGTAPETGAAGVAPGVRVGIVGGGISGLAVAHGLAVREVPHVLFEAADEPGGVIRSEVVEGRVLDMGPQRTRRTAEVAALVDALGLEDEVLEARPDLPLYVYSRGRLRPVPFDLGAALRTDLLGPLAKLRAALEPLAGGPRPGDSVEDYLVRGFGRQAYRRLLGPIYGGLYASDPGRMRARHGLATALRRFGVGRSLLVALLRRGRRAHRGLATITFRGGLGRLCHALAGAPGVDVRPGSPVRAVERAPGGGFALRVQGGPGGDAVERVDRVVLAAPAPACAQILRGLAPDVADRIGRLRYNRLAVVHAVADASPPGLGYQVAFGEPLETRGVTWNGGMFGDVESRRGLFTVYLGGMKNPSLVDEADDSIARIAVEELARAAGVEARPVRVSRTWIPAWDESWDALDDLALPEGVGVCASWHERPGLPGRLRQAADLVSALAGRAAAGSGDSGPV